MRTSQHFLIGLICVTFLVGTVALVQPPSGQALDTKDDYQFKKILKKIFPPCGPGTRGQRFVMSPKHLGEVCDNKTGVYWQQTPGAPPDASCANTDTCTWQQAIEYCEGLNENGENQKKTWRLPEWKKRPGIA